MNTTELHELHSWVDQQLAKTGDSGVSMALRHFHAVWELESEAYMGGLGHYLRSSAADSITLAIDGLRAIGAKEAANILVVARAQRRGGYQAEIEALDQRFYTEAVSIDQQLIAYLDANGYQELPNLA